MSCEQKKTTWLLVAITFYFIAFRVTYSVSLGQREEDLRTHSDAQQRGWRRVERAIKSPRLREPVQPGINELRRQSAGFPEGPVPCFSASTPDETDRNVVLNGSSWTFGHTNPRPKSSSSSSGDGDGDGYQADFAGFEGAQGKVLGRSLDSSPEWQAMRPLLRCDNNAMTFTASGKGLTHLLLSSGASPISPFHLPPCCGYSVRTTWSYLEMTVSYDACYITEETGSYVLPLLWQGLPLKLSCPMPLSIPPPTRSHSGLSLFCSQHGMAVQILWQEQEMPMMEVAVNGFWDPFVSEKCAYPVRSCPGALTFFIPYSAPCFTRMDGLYLQLILNCQGYILSCPSPLPSPGNPQFPFNPEPTSTPPPPLPLTQEQVVQFPQYFNTDDQTPPQVYPPGLEHDSPPGSQPNPQYSSPPHQETKALGPELTSSTSTFPTASPPTRSSEKLTPVLQCLKDRMVVFLPFAHPDYIQVRDQGKSWLLLSTVPPQCGFMQHVAKHSGVFLQSPLPACYSQQRTPTTISLTLRFWDLSLAQYRTVDLQCQYETIPVTPAPSPSPTPTLPKTTKRKPHSPDVPKPEVVCHSDQMNVELPSGPISKIIVKDIQGNQMNLRDAPKHCGYSAKKGDDGKIRLSLQLHSRCHMSVQDNMYIITIYYTAANERREAQFSCPVIMKILGQECKLPIEQHLPCGPDSVSKTQCLSKGCCFNKKLRACHYPMDECTVDRHFVFSVPASLTEPPLSPALLATAGDSPCKPQKVTSSYALFKIPMDSCGTRRVMVGKTMVYIVEVINTVQTLTLNYGTITRESPVRLLVECRYVPNTVLSVSYMVKTPTLGPNVQSQAVFGVQLRIAKDDLYTSYYPQYHQPLQMLLGKPLYLEVRLLNSPDPDLVLLVHFCVAYPRSGKAVWLLLYNGCPNPLDPALQKAVLVDPLPPPLQAQTRRFTITTFQFLPDAEFKDPDEEIYFMCSTEICSPEDGPCVEGCFGQ
nr:uncharacterized protein LOC109994381 [Labrus bergylta]